MCRLTAVLFSPQKAEEGESTPVVLPTPGYTHVFFFIPLLSTIVMVSPISVIFLFDLSDFFGGESDVLRIRRILRRSIEMIKKRIKGVSSLFSDLEKLSLRF